MATAQRPQTRSNARVIGWCLAGVLGMFAFGFALVPLYEVFCDITGINGKTGGRYEGPVSAEVDQKRQVKVQFIAQNGPGMPWTFRPRQTSITVHPGEPTRVTFFAQNRTAAAMTAQAIPSLSPSQGTLFFHKTECFCFNQQTLAAGQSIDMPLVFIVDRALPEEITTLTLSYTLYDQSKLGKDAAAPAVSQQFTPLQPTTNPWQITTTTTNNG